MKVFFQELRKRHVVKVGIAYLVASWLVLQLADVIFPAMGLPDWSITMALGLLAVGFPVALVLAWVFDVTPEGIQRTDALANDERDDPVVQKQASVTVRDRSIAVLPFADLSAERDQEHFCDGLTEELLTVLTCIPNLRVASRTSCFAFKSKKTELAEVAEKLRVAHILEGSVRKDGNKVRISAQLIEVATDSHLWSETWDRELRDIFAIQDDIAHRIREALKLKLGSRRISDPTTTDAKAWEYFLRARGYYITNKQRDVDRAIDMYQKAVAIDPAFVRAWIGLAEVSSVKALFLGDGAQAKKIADAAGARAMELAPERGGSVFARGVGQLACHCYPEAEEALLIAVKLDPGLVRAYHWLARVAHHQGQLEKELEYFAKATELDPEDWESPNLALGVYQEAGDMEGARASAQIGVERIEKHLEDYPDNPRAYYLGVGGLMILGETERAHRWAERALSLAPDDPPTRYNLACFYARAGNIEKSLDLLENSITSRSWIENDTDLDSLRDHPRYQAMLDSLPN